MAETPAKKSETVRRRGLWTARLSRFVAWAAPSLFLLIVGLCFVLPVVVIGWVALRARSSGGAAPFEHYFLKLLGKTVVFNALAAIVAVGAALPCAISCGRGRGWMRSALLLLLPVSLLLPTVAFEYGWKQALRLSVGLPEAQSVADVARCVWTLAAWLWPIPAVAGAIALRRAGQSVLEQAALDGALTRVTMRILLAPMLTAGAAVFVLASQEFAVFEPTGIRIVATETRTMYETTGGGQTDRVAAAVRVASPLMLLTLLVAGGVVLAASRWRDETEPAPTPASGATLAPAYHSIAALLVVAITTILPIVAMTRALSVRRPVGEILTAFSPLMSGSILLAGGAMLVAVVLALEAIRTPHRFVLALAIVSFLLGGQMIALAMIWSYNRDWLWMVYDSPVVTVLAYVARFGWIVLVAALFTWGRGWRAMREMAEVDGASRGTIARSVVLPLAWPMLAAGVGLVGILSLTEVPATMLIGPLRPQPIVPVLMSWVHLQQFDAMIEGTLMLCGVVIVSSVLVLGLIWLARRRRIGIALLALLPLGCERSAQPREVWLETGMGNGQVVYPRAIDHRAGDDTFVVIDRMARVQRIDSRGNFLTAWRMPDFELGKPVGVTVGPDGNIYVPDTHYQRVVVYTPDGKEIRRWGKEGFGPGEFTFPTDVAFDSKGRIFVSEYGGHDRVQVFDANGDYLSEFGKPGAGDGEFSRPQSMVVLGDTLYVTDACNHRIAVFSTDGKWQRNIGSVGTAPGQFRFPYGLTADADGNLIVTEFGNNRVQKIEPRTGKSLGIWGVAGRAPGELAYPWASAIDRNGRVVIVDSGNNRLQVVDGF